MGNPKPTTTVMAYAEGVADAERFIRFHPGEVEAKVAFYRTSRQKERVRRGKRKLLRRHPPSTAYLLAFERTLRAA